jgi:hypothetical protein
MKSDSMEKRFEDLEKKVLAMDAEIKKLQKVDAKTKKLHKK